MVCRIGAHAHDTIKIRHSSITEDRRTLNWENKYLYQSVSINISRILKQGLLKRCITVS